jgi:hypothetical protein
VKRSTEKSIQQRFEFVALWLVAAALSGVAIYTVGSLVADEYGTARAALLCGGVVMVARFVVILYYNDDYEAGQGGRSIFQSVVSVRLPSPFSWPARIRGFFAFKDMDRPWLKAVLVGGFIGILVLFKTTVEPAKAAASKTGSLRGQPMGEVELDLVAGGVFRTEDLAGRTSVVFVRTPFSASAPAFFEEWDRSVENGSNPLGLTVMLLDSYGDVRRHQSKLTHDPVNRYPTAVGKRRVQKWPTTNLSNGALVFVIGPDTTVQALFTPEEPADVVVATIIGEFADRVSP